MAATGAMITNDGPMTNEEDFRRTLERVEGGGLREMWRKPLTASTGRCFRVYPASFRGRWRTPPTCCRKSKGPASCWWSHQHHVSRQTILERLRWAKLHPGLFDLITCYEIMHAGKPNPAHYREICDKLGDRARRCGDGRKRSRAGHPGCPGGGAPHLSGGGRHTGGTAGTGLRGGASLGRARKAGGSRRPGTAGGRPVVPGAIRGEPQAQDGGGQEARGP